MVSTTLPTAAVVPTRAVNGGLVVCSGVCVDSTGGWEPPLDERGVMQPQKHAVMNTSAIKTDAYVRALMIVNAKMIHI